MRGFLFYSGRGHEDCPADERVWVHWAGSADRVWLLLLWSGIRQHGAVLRGASLLWGLPQELCQRVSVWPWKGLCCCVKERVGVWSWYSLCGCVKEQVGVWSWYCVWGCVKEQVGVWPWYSLCSCVKEQVDVWSQEGLYGCMKRICV